jgi:hypothetical protein
MLSLPSVVGATCSVLFLFRLSIAVNTQQKEPIRKNDGKQYFSFLSVFDGRREAARRPFYIGCLHPCVLCFKRPSSNPPAVSFFFFFSRAWCFLFFRWGGARKSGENSRTTARFD